MVQAEAARPPVRAHGSKQSESSKDMADETYLLQLRLRGRHLEQLMWDVMVVFQACDAMTDGAPCLDPKISVTWR